MTDGESEAIRFEISASVPPLTWQGDWDSEWHKAAARMIHDLRKRVAELEQELLNAKAAKRGAQFGLEPPLGWK